MSFPTSNPPVQSDPLGASLHLLRLEGTLYSQGALTAPWSIAVPRLDGHLTFLFVTRGRCWLVLEGHEPIRMEQGSLALIPHATPHLVCSDPDLTAVPLFDIPVEKVSDRLEVMHHGGGGELTRTMYGCVRFDHLAGQHLITHLPEVIQIDGWEDETGDWLQSTLRFVAHEAAQLRPGGETVITRLADVVVIQALRSWLDNAPEAHRGWLAALRDPQIGRALAMIHAQPGADWTVDRLASTVGQSRSAFAARFASTVGLAPMAYVTQWRLSLAQNRIIETTDPIAAIARDLSYQSEAAFCRAFKRHFAVSPGSLRRGDPTASSSSHKGVA
jgi:AraC-like DNA-binding protein